jgi:hypothetical protein
VDSGLGLDDERTDVSWVILSRVDHILADRYTVGFSSAIHHGYGVLHAVSQMLSIVRQLPAAYPGGGIAVIRPDNAGRSVA